MKDETIAIHAGYKTDPTTKSVAVPIYQTVAYEFDNAQHGADLFNLAVPGNIYTRIVNAARVRRPSPAGRRMIWRSGCSASQLVSAKRWNSSSTCSSGAPA